MEEHARERAENLLRRFHAVLDRDLAHDHHKTTGRILERAVRRAVTLGAGPDLPCMAS
ncbi:MAG: hypothetical protein R3D34_18675 [Nitratireductor sp.]